MSLSDLPDEALLVILNKLDTREAVRCSVLSRRWRRVPGMLPNIELDVDSFTPDHDDGFTSTLSDAARNNYAMVSAVQSLLSHESRHDIRRLDLSFFSRDESVGIIHAIDDAMARGRRILDLRFDVLSEKSYMECPDSDRVKQGRRLLHCFDRYPRVFAGLTSLHLECVTVQGPRFSDVITACEKLIDLSLVRCNFGKETALTIQHEQLSMINLEFCTCDTVELEWLPKLSELSMSVWFWSPRQYPLVFGHAPRLQRLELTHAGLVHSKVLRLSKLLDNCTSLRELWLDFECEKVTDHHCVPLEEELLERMFICEKNNINWEPSNFKHNNLTKLIIYGFRPENRFMSYIRRVMKAAVNLDEISLHDDRPKQPASESDVGVGIGNESNDYAAAASQTNRRYGQAFRGQGTMSLSDLPDEALLVILNKLDTREALRCSVLSRRWRRVPGMLPNIELDVDSFTPDHDDGFTSTLSDDARNSYAMVSAVQSLLSHESRHDIRRLDLSFFSRDESVGIIHAIDDAMARGRRILKMCFDVVSEKCYLECPDRDRVKQGKRLLYCFDAYPHVFAGLTSLHLECITVQGPCFSNVITACEKLSYLSLVYCDFGEETPLTIHHEHLRVVKLEFCTCDTVELEVPDLLKLMMSVWSWSPRRYPFVFGHAPRLQRLELAHAGLIDSKMLQLSKLLDNCTSLRELWLNFEREKIWILPETPTRLAPLLNNLTFVGVHRIHPNSGITWTLFLLEAAPLLKMLSIKVTDHQCKPIEGELLKRTLCEKNNIYWEPSDFKHYSLTMLIFYGFQPGKKCMEYIRQVIKRAVNLEDILLHDDRCEATREATTRPPPLLAAAGLLASSAQADRGPAQGGDGNDHQIRTAPIESCGAAAGDGDGDGSGDGDGRGEQRPSRDAADGGGDGDGGGGVRGSGGGAALDGAASGLPHVWRWRLWCSHAGGGAVASAGGGGEEDG
ncbi:hypothetical protein OsJ_15233 [Oryza sativa Japonica Group]|uniref:F-box domain-containing protein n=1 Tax=Oryza sativa subsp. japonica TaxID=39947 RepID=B9FFS7_ORYSJ|nr:hypothetical protein OsJ_15233 [Oryza sativa Japonica Group]